MPLSVSLDPDLEKRLYAMAKATGKPAAEHVRNFVEEGLEDFEDLQAAEAVSDRVRRGEERTYSSAEIRRELGLDD